MIRALREWGERWACAPGPGTTPRARSLTGRDICTVRPRVRTGRGARAAVEPHLAAAVVDVFVYVVVLNLFVEYLPVVISETFTLSLLTAVLLKGVLEVVVARQEAGGDEVPPGRHADRQGGGRDPGLGGPVRQQVPRPGGRRARLRPRVSLGGFFSVTALIVILMLSRAGVRRLLEAADPRG